jgi:hypothetical protein
MMQVPAHEVIHVVAVGSTLMAALGPMAVLPAVRFAVVLRSAIVRVRVTYRNEVFIDVIRVDVMQMAVVEIVDMPFMTDLHMAADLTVHMIVGRVRGTFGVLHASSFLTGGSELIVGRRAREC